MPPFSFGANLLVPNAHAEDKQAVADFVHDWFTTPEKYLDYTKFHIPRITKHDSKYSFSSVVGNEDTASFFESLKKQPRGRYRAAFIIAPQWNPDPFKYRIGTSFIRNFFLPVSTYIYIPFARGMENVRCRYDVVGPNIGSTLKRFWQDVLNVQRFATYLKKELGYDRVGIWAYSIGSPRSMLASIFSDAIDILVMNFLADSFPRALMEGISTQNIAAAIRPYIPMELLEELWSPLSPGRYAQYFKNLPIHTLLVQPKYDLVFGEDNNERLVRKMREGNPSVRISYENCGHHTYRELDKLYPIIKKIGNFAVAALQKK